jgi:hypothetical protein
MLTTFVKQMLNKKIQQASNNETEYVLLELKEGVLCNGVVSNLMG